jgi:hypothetical protein
MEYSTDIIFPKSDAGVIREVVNEIAREKWGNKIPPFKYEHLHDGDDKIDRDTGEPREGYAGMAYIKAKAQEDNAPKVVDAARNGLTDKIRGGDVCNVYVSPYAYDKGANRGIAFSLVAVQLVQKAAKPFGGGVSKDKALDVLDEFVEPAFDL